MLALLRSAIELVEPGSAEPTYGVRELWLDKTKALVARLAAAEGKVAK
jgi:hypothetical protein